MNKSPKENFDAFNNFKGMGNPDSKIWFVGLEEGGEPISQKNIDEKVRECSIFPYYMDAEDVQKSNTQVWTTSVSL